MTAADAAIRIDWCPLDRLAALQSFVDMHWSRGHVLARDAELMRWQHRHPTDPERLAVLVADRGEEMVGILGLIPYAFCDHGQRLDAAWLTTWQVRPGRDVQVAGLRLMGEAIRRYSVVGTIGANAYVMPAFEALGFDNWPEVPRWVRVLDGGALDALLAEAPEIYPERTRMAWCDRGEETLASSEALDWRLVDGGSEHAPAWDRTWRDTFAPHLRGTWRDTAYLDWRYRAHPSFDYSVRLVLDGNGTACGLSVDRLEKLRGRSEVVVRLVEFLATDTAAPALAADVIGRARAAGATMIDFFCTGSTFARPLEQAGFVREKDMPSALPSLFQPLELEPRPLRAAFRVGRDHGDSADYFRSSRLYLTRSDCDQDRPN